MQNILCTQKKNIDKLIKHIYWASGGPAIHLYSVEEDQSETKELKKIK